MPEQTYTMMISEILDHVHKAKNRNEKIKLLKFHESKPLKYILKAVFDDKIKFNIPRSWPKIGDINYTPDDAPDGHNPSSLYVECRKFPMFCVDGGGENLTQSRREFLFKIILESVNAAEAELLVKMLQKDLQIDGLTPGLVLKAFPGLFAWEDPRKKKDPPVVAIESTDPVTAGDAVGDGGNSE
jgi:hypothetical protein